MGNTAAHGILPPSGNGTHYGAAKQCRQPHHMSDDCNQKPCCHMDFVIMSNSATATSPNDCIFIQYLRHHQPPCPRRRRSGHSFHYRCAFPRAGGLSEPQPWTTPSPTSTWTTSWAQLHYRVEALLTASRASAFSPR